jgi:hypothetical protein
MRCSAMLVGNLAGRIVSIRNLSDFPFSFQNVVLVTAVGRTMREECANLSRRMRDLFPLFMVDFHLLDRCR